MRLKNSQLRVKFVSLNENRNTMRHTQKLRRQQRRRRAAVKRHEAWKKREQERILTSIRTEQ